jgi:nucleoside transporter
MMILQYLVWGIWLPGLGQFMGGDGGIGLTPREQGWIFTVYGFGAIIGPFVIGQLADRYFATENVLAACHFIGGLLLIAAAYTTSFWPLFGLLFLYCNLYMPTMGLTNSLTFRTLGEERQVYFPYIRAFGTIGWILAGLGYGQYLIQAKGGSPLQPLFDLSFVGKPTFRDCLRLPGVLSILYSIYCLTLPHTPPVPAKASDPIDKRSAVLESLELMRNRSFAVLVTITGLVGIMLAFYFGCETYFLGHLGTQPERVVQYMTIGQGAELFLMFLVPLAVARLGVKTTMILGALAWAVRFGLSAIGQPYWLMISTIALHGFAFGFFFVPAQMYVDRAASPDIKATAQNLLVFVVYGLGTILGSIISGEIRGYFGSNWFAIWIGPTVLTILCIVAFAVLFHEGEEIRKPVVQGEPVLS